MGQFLVFFISSWFSSVSASRPKTAIFHAGISFLEAAIQEMLRLLIDLLRMIYFLLNAWAFPAFRKWYFNAVFFFLMLTGYNSVSRGMINLKVTLIPSIILKLQAQRQSYRAWAILMQEITVSCILYISCSLCRYFVT